MCSTLVLAYCFIFSPAHAKSADRLDHNLGTVSWGGVAVKALRSAAGNEGGMRVLRVMLVLALLAACSRPAVTPHDRLTIVQTQDFPSLDPLFVSGIGGQELAALLFSYLVKLDDHGRLVPDAAEVVPSVANGGISRDGLRITYHLRPGLRFSDGSPLTSADVAATIRRIQDPRSDVPSRNGFSDIEAVTTPDARTIVLRLERPYAPIVLYICGPGNAVPILSRRQLGAAGSLRRAALDASPLGSGPYRIRRWERGDRLELERNPFFAGPAAALRRITIVPVPSSNTALEMLRAHEADAFVNADDAQVPQLRALPGVRVEDTPIDGTGALIFNTQRPALRDPKIRRAVAEAFDVPGAVDRTLLAQRSSDPGAGLFEWAYDPHAFAMPRYDPVRARAMLRGRKLHLDLIVRADKPSSRTLATLLQAQGRAAGIAISVRTLDVSTLVAPDGPLYGGRFDLALFPFVAGFDPDVYDQFACSRIPPNGFNKPRYCNPQLDRLMREAVRPYDRAARMPYYERIEAILARDLPLVALYRAHSINAFPTWLHGEHSAPDTPFWNVAEWKP
jgi:peptide/nickel transport system substrate-binding protein